MTESVGRTIVLPAYNEEGFIEDMVRLSIKAAEERQDSFEIIVVDNASTDRTAALVEALARDDSRVRLIRHSENRLYAGSCASGCEAAKGERVFILDSDGQHPPTDIWKFDEKLDEGYDLVFGHRTHREEPITRIAMSRFLRFLARAYIGFKLSDVNCGIRGMSRKYVDGLEFKYKVNFVNPELFVRAKQRNLRIGETPVLQEKRKAGVSSHEFGRLWQIFRTVTTYLGDLRRELRSSRKLSSSL